MEALEILRRNAPGTFNLVLTVRRHSLCPHLEYAQKVLLLAFLHKIAFNISACCEQTTFASRTLPLSRT